MSTPPDTSQHVSLTWIALLRIALGLMFLTTWYSNLQKGFYTADGLQVFFTEVFPQSENPLTWYAAFINSVILPIRGFFSVFQLLTELLMGLALLVGLLTPLASLAAIFFLGNTFLATFGHDWPWAYLLPISMAGVCFFTRAGRALGVDAYLRKRYGPRRLPLW
jgi:NADH dehydrogenase